MMPYRKFFLMLFVSLLIMYFVMFLNMDQLSHYHTSATRVYMAFLMISPMAIVMLAFMGGMYKNKKTNAAILTGAVVVFAVVLTALRTQTPISDVNYMKAMIPHHSSAIMVSKHANLKDPEVRALADSIIASQQQEIAQMEAALKRLEQ